MRGIFLIESVLFGKINIKRENRILPMPFIEKQIYANSFEISDRNHRDAGDWQRAFLIFLFPFAFTILKYFGNIMLLERSICIIKHTTI